MCIHVFIFIYRYTYIHIYIYIHICVYTYICVYIYISVQCGYNNTINHPPVITIVGMSTIPKWVVYDCYTHINANIWENDHFVWVNQLVFFFV